MTAFREQGAPLCRDRRGRLSLGPVVHGDVRSVNVPLSCPSGTEAVGFWHTHPPEAPQPSRQDLREAQRLGLEYVCVATEDRPPLCVRVRRQKG